jgi:hypothetical protein
MTRGQLTREKGVDGRGFAQPRFTWRNNSITQSHLQTNKERTNKHNGGVPTTFCDDLMPLSRFDASVCGAGTGNLRRCSQTWLGRLAMPMPSREGAGLAIVMSGREVGATETLTSKNRSPAKSFGIN